MEEQQNFNPLAIAHLLQYTLRSLCMQENSQWVYAVCWRILPRNYPPPKWDLQGRMYDGSRGNRRNWMLVWEDGFCNFGASACEQAAGASSEEVQVMKPELFFKMSHEIYNYGEGIIGKVAADHSHRWVFKEPHEQETSFLPAWNNPADSYPRTWEAQFQSGGIKTIALIAVREGVIQLGSLSKVVEDLSIVVLLRKKFSYLESIPGVFLPHPSSSDMPISIPPEHRQSYRTSAASLPSSLPPLSMEIYDQYLSSDQQAMRITPSMSSLEALLAKLPSVGPPVQPASSAPHGYYENMTMAKEEFEQEYGSTNSMS